MAKETSRFIEKLQGHTTERELLYALRAMEVLLSSGIGLESAIKHVAEGNYGEISIEFQKILDEINSGEYIVNSLKKAVARTKSRGLKKALTTMVIAAEGDINLVETFAKIAEKETKERRVALDGYIDKLSTTTEIFMVVGILIPIILGAVLLADSMFQENPQFKAKTFMTPTIAAVILAIDLIVLAGMIFRTKKIEPQV